MSFLPIIFLAIIVVLFWKSTSDPYRESEEAVHVVAKKGGNKPLKNYPDISQIMRIAKEAEKNPKKFSDMTQEEVRKTIYGPIHAPLRTYWRISMVLVPVGILAWCISGYVGGFFEGDGIWLLAFVGFIAVIGIINMCYWHYVLKLWPK